MDFVLALHFVVAFFLGIVDLLRLYKRLALRLWERIHV